MALSTGDRLGRYEILAPLGAGGMGEVYRAQDTELEREVAVKILPEAVAGDSSRLERFQREAKAVARLSHPNILEIFDVGSDNGVQYAVTELLEGQTLRERVPASGLPWQKVVEMGVGIAEGLAAAHGKRIVHRDLKPENVFVTSDGRVKVLDFGLARFSEEVSTEDETGTLTPAGTQVGTIMGTVGYMAPEQVAGKPADHRSDIFALGCVLYEMVSGRRAFKGDTGVEIMAAILKEEPPQLSSTGAQLPSDLERAIHRCLEKSPEARFQSAADLAYSLKSIGTSPAVPMATPTGELRPATRRRWPVVAVVGVLMAGALLVGWFNLRRAAEESVVDTAAPVEVAPTPWLEEWRVAVEPLDNRTGDPALDPIGRTLTDRLIENLARIDQGLQSLTPVKALPAGVGGVGPGTAEEGLSEGVGRLLVTGFFSDRGAALEVDVQVRDPETRGVLYATGPVEVPRRFGAADLEPLQEKVMGAVATHVHLRLQNVSHVPDYAVIREYLGGVEDIWSGRDWAGGNARIDRALEVDPEFLQPAVWRAGSALNRNQPEEAAKYIDHIAQRRQRLTEYESLFLMGAEAWRDGEPARAVRASRELQRLAPQDILVRYSHARFAGDLGAYDEVVETLADVIDHLPLPYELPRAWFRRQLIRSYQELGRFDEQLALARRLRGENPGETRMYGYEANALAALGRLDELAETVAECERVPGGQCDAAVVLSEVSWSLAAHGHRDAARSYALRSVEMYRSGAQNGGVGFNSEFVNALRAAELWDEYGAYARQALEKFEEGSDNHAYLRGAIGMAAAHLGNRPEAEAVMSRLETEEKFVYAGYVAAHLGELDRALEYFKRAVASQPEMGWDQFLRWDLDLEPLWEYPPFEELINPKQ
jgi:serine/threonine protein kinase/tetratricopeptide (TPR) repeat protein